MRQVCVIICRYKCNKLLNKYYKLMSDEKQKNFDLLKKSLIRYIFSTPHIKVEIERQEKRTRKERTNCWNRRRRKGEKDAWEEEGSLSTMTGREVIVTGKFNALLWTSPYNVCTNLPKSLTHVSSRNLPPLSFLSLHAFRASSQLPLL